jgi:vacuolar-type H+-ATPase subunit H
MSEAKGVLEAQLEALLELVESYRDTSRRRIEEQARTQAEEIVAHARREARVHMRAAIEQERTRAREKITSTRAHLLTQRRQRRQQLDKGVVEEGWVKLHEALTKRWRNADQRRVWVGAQVERGHALLPARDWRVEHAPGWDPDEMLRLHGELSALARDRSPTFVEDPSITAGLRIRVDGTCLDATTEGLLANRSDVEAELLAEVSRP